MEMCIKISTLLDFAQKTKIPLHVNVHQLGKRKRSNNNKEKQYFTEQY
jgi:hypothetical protein